jgi:hypothetical protein
MKLIFENWRRFMAEQVAGTVVAKKGARSKAPENVFGVSKDDTIKTLPAELMPILYDVIVGDKETFSKIDEKYDIDELKNKSYEEIKHDAKYKDLIEEMLHEPVEMLKAVGHYGQIKKGEYKDFFDFVLKLPEEQRIHVLTALAVYSEKWTDDDAIGLIVFGIDQIKIYGCLFHERNPGSFKVKPEDYKHCRNLKRRGS